MYDLILEAKSYIESKRAIKPTIGLILGSGLGGITALLEDAVEIPYKEIPNFPKSSLEGHKGSLFLGRIYGKNVVIMSGRFHHYEGYSQKEITLPIYVMKFLGVTELIITNACGGINASFTPGDIMVIDDFINLMGDNPLIGENDARLGKRFPDMTEPFKLTLIEKIKAISGALNIPLKQGVYAGFMGPYYETKAEIRMIRTIGADAVGMSTVPEVIAANHAGLDVLGLAVITNMATGIQTVKHDHLNVLKVANQASNNVIELLKAYLKSSK